MLLVLIGMTTGAYTQTKEQAMLALRSEEHTKVEVIDTVVVFHDHIDSLRNVNNYNFFALELAESLYKQMADNMYTPYFNALFSEGYIYRNIIESQDGTIITIEASSKYIDVEIIKYPSKEVIHELFEF